MIAAFKHSIEAAHVAAEWYRVADHIREQLPNYGGAAREALLQDMAFAQRQHQITSAISRFYRYEGMAYKFAADREFHEAMNASFDY